MSCLCDVLSPEFQGVRIVRPILRPSRCWRSIQLWLRQRSATNWIVEAIDCRENVECYDVWEALANQEAFKRFNLGSRENDLVSQRCPYSDLSSAHLSQQLYFGAKVAWAHRHQAHLILLLAARNPIYKDGVAIQHWDKGGNPMAEGRGS